MKNKVLKLLILTFVIIIFIILIVLSNQSFKIQKSNNNSKMYESKLNMKTEVKEAYITYIQYLIKFTDEENGIQKIIYPDGEEIYTNNKKSVAIDYIIREYKDYEFKVIDGKGEQYTETLKVEPMIVPLIPKMTKNIGENGVASCPSLAGTEAYWAFDNNYNTCVRYEKEDVNGLYVQYTFNQKYHITEFTATIGATRNSFILFTNL